MNGIPKRQFVAVLLVAPLAAVFGGVAALLSAGPQPKTSGNAPLLALYAVVLWSVPVYVIGSLVTVLAYVCTSPASRLRKFEVFAIHLGTGLLIGAMLASRSPKTTLLLIWIVGTMGAVMGTVAAFAVPGASATSGADKRSS
jgi:hypothetical protein